MYKWGQVLFAVYVMLFLFRILHYVERIAKLLE